MDNSFFILSKQTVAISRFHICTWDIENSNTFIELGIEFNFPENIQEIDFKFAAPFVRKGDKIKCLLNQLKLRDNSKFIFNDIIKNSSPINDDDIHGTILDFKTRDKLAILPANNITIEEDGLIAFKLKKPKIDGNVKCYVRFLININSETLSTKKKGITKTTFLYDIRLNENRNLPNNVATLTQDYSLCKIKNCFCLHVIPNSFNISFVDQNKMKNVRILEVSAFKNYLPEELKMMKEGKSMIVFNKSSDTDAYSFFTIFTKETIGSKQILFAVGANIVCSLLFGFSTLRTSFDSNSNLWKQIPMEYWGASIILLILIILLFKPYKILKKTYDRRH
ncbi:MAG: hypothetical protein LBV41_04275 [Cytophagaceae bacterium]|jgi:hypothetical protein|nr:hypothetical protein [Cytophagaceae bacterium]